jgi:uroporphyrinogen-III synthase
MVILFSSAASSTSFATGFVHHHKHHKHHHHHYYSSTTTTTTKFQKRTEAAGVASRRHAHQYTKMLLLQASSSSSFSTTPEKKIVVAVTREDGKNAKLINQVQSNPTLLDHVELVELPCIAHADGPDFERLGSVLVSQPWNYVVITSPEAARVLASAWDTVFSTTTTTSTTSNDSSSSSPPSPPAVAAVGKATEMTLKSFGIPVTFTPSKATAETLAAELSLVGTTTTTPTTTTVLYPASAKAQDTLQSGLTARGFAVTRLNTYDTVTATWNDTQQHLARQVQVACFASPSSVKGWLANTGDGDGGRRDVLAACIGETSAKACRNQEWSADCIFYPEQPGLEGWVDAIAQAAQKIQSSRRAETTTSSASSSTSSS